MSTPLGYEPQPRPWLVRLGHDVEEEVTALAAFDGRSRNWVVRALCESALGIDTERARLIKGAQGRIHALADEAERGYDVDQLRPR